MLLKDYILRLKIEPNNTELKNEFLKACYNVYIKAGGSEIKLRFLSYNEGISYSKIRQNAHIYMINSIGFTKQNYSLNIIFEYLKFQKYDFNETIFENVDITKLYNNDFYKDSFSKLTEENKTKFLILVTKIKQMMCLIENGIKFDGGTKKFDIIDFYKLLRMDLIHLDKICKYCNFSADEIRTYKHFLGENSLENINSAGISFIEKDSEFFLKKDSNDNLIPGSGIVFTTLEKEKIVEYLKEIYVPINHRNLMIASKRYIDGTLFDDLLVKKDDNIKMKSL